MTEILKQRERNRLRMEDDGGNNPSKQISIPSSPEVGPVKLKACIEEVLKFTLASAVAGTLPPGCHVYLPKDYCSALLVHANPPLNPILNSSYSSSNGGLAEGVPEYPLYRRLALALYEYLSSGAFSRPYDKMILIPEDSSWKQNGDDWIKVITGKGSELLKVLKSVEFELHVQEPFFSQLKDGAKTVEGRCAVGDYNRIVSGALILFNKCLVLQVRDVHRYASFAEMLELESLAKVLPGVETIEQGVQVYRNFYSEEKERLNGVLAIHFTFPISQLYTTMSRILSKLGYGGIQKLLGFVHTVGTTIEALPPSRSTLLSSFLLPLNLNVKGSILTDGARALAKHVNRSSSLYWGTFMGSDSDKNRRAMEVVSDLIAHCCWQNMHIVPPHGVVYEIRAADGYGARWSEDGTKFIGFLEPYMEDGHSKGWRH